MSRSQKRRDKDKYEPIKEEEWIEMEDLRAPRNENLSRKFAEEGRMTHMQRANSMSPPNKNLNKIPNLSTITTETMNLFPRISPLTQPEARLPQKDYNQFRAFPRSRKETANQNQEAQHADDVSLYQPRQVTCNYCTVVQSLPGNAQLYICGSCENMNEC